MFMTHERDKEEESQRKKGIDLDLAEEHIETKPYVRQAKTFTPNEDERQTEAPEAITAGERLPHISEYSGIRLESLPLKGLKTFIYAAASLLAITVAWDIYDTFNSVLQIHWIAGLAFAGLLLLVGSLVIRLILSYLRDGENYEVLQNIQKHARRLSEGHDFGNATKLNAELQAFYTDKPQAVYLKRCLEQLPDYSNDREVVDHIDRVFVQPLDQEALRRISSFSMQTGTAVALSPWMALDMVVALWHNIKMIDDIGQVYGVRPSLTNRYKLLKMVINSVVFAGTSEMVIDAALEEASSSALASMASARLGQGLGVGIYSARIGIAAMKVCRPVELSKDKQPKVSSLIRPMIKNLKSMFRATKSDETGNAVSADMTSK